MEVLKKRVEEAGKIYYSEAEKITVEDRSAKLFTAVTNYRSGLPVDPLMKPFVDAYIKLHDLKVECGFKHNVDISLIDLTVLPEGVKYDNERKLKSDYWKKSIAAAKRNGEFDPN